LTEPLRVDDWLNNGVNVIFADKDHIRDAVKSGEFPPRADRQACAGVRKLTGVDICSVLFRGLPVIDAKKNVVETPNQQPIFEVPGGVVTLSRTTVRIAADAGFQLKRAVRVIPESADGVRIDIYGELEATFRKLFSEIVLPGDRLQLDYVLTPGKFHHAVIRVHPGPNLNEQGDWLLWEN
jgi:hypothetical protein